MGKVATHFVRLPKTSPNLALNTFRDRVSTVYSAPVLHLVFFIWLSLWMTGTFNRLNSTKCNKYWACIVLLFFSWHFAILLMKAEKKDKMLKRTSYRFFNSQLRMLYFILSVKYSRCNLRSHHYIASNAFSYEYSMTSHKEKNAELN